MSITNALMENSPKAHDNFLNFKAKKCSYLDLFFAICAIKNFG